MSPLVNAENWQISTFAIDFRSISCKSPPCYFDSTKPLAEPFLLLLILCAGRVNLKFVQCNPRLRTSGNILNTF